jgi:hypothetical protein
VVKGADLAATHPPSGASLRSRTSRLSLDACRGSRMDRVGPQQQLAQPSVTHRSDVPTVHRCCHCSDWIAAEVVARVVAGAAGGVVGADLSSRVRHAVGLDQRQLGLVESRPVSQGGAIGD